MPSLLSRLLDPAARAMARQLSRPSGWFGRTVMPRFFNRRNRALVEATLAGIDLRPGSRLLDVGFGGGLLLDLAQRRGVRSLAGVDPSSEAVTWMKAQRSRFEGTELRLEVGAVEALPFPDASFDVVASTNTVYFWPDLALAFSELRRVLAPGGLVSIGFSGAAKLRGYGPVTQHGFCFHELPALVAAASQAGFVGVRVLELHGRGLEGDHVLRGMRG